MWVGPRADVTGLAFRALGRDDHGREARHRRVVREQLRHPEPQLHHVVRAALAHAVQEEHARVGPPSRSPDARKRYGRASPAPFRWTAPPNASGTGSAIRSRSLARLYGALLLREQPGQQARLLERVGPVVVADIGVLAVARVAPGLLDGIHHVS